MRRFVFGISMSTLRMQQSLRLGHIAVPKFPYCKRKTPKRNLIQIAVRSRRDGSRFRSPWVVKAESEKETVAPLFPNMKDAVDDGNGSSCPADDLEDHGFCVDEEFGGEDSLLIKTLRRCLTPMESPFQGDGIRGGSFVEDGDMINLHSVKFTNRDSLGAGCGHGIADVSMEDDVCLSLPTWAVRSGPRRQIYFNPRTVSAAVVTCGGLCPGLNDVVQAIVETLCNYGVPEDNILGIRYGLRGFYAEDCRPITLKRSSVDGIHMRGGTMLGTSRGGADICRIVKRIDLWGLNMLFVLGGNGGNAAANAIQEECERQGVVCSVIAVPKSIDNDILIVDKCFGFDTAVEEAERALLAAKVEAKSARKGVGLVKLMGRQSGFIAMKASMSSGVVDVCLIPEVPFRLDKLCEFVDKIVKTKGHCVVCIAEGCGQDVLGESGQKDASGNPVLSDIGDLIKQEFNRYFENDVDIKYIDPTYMIRAIPTCSSDHVYCNILGQGAVHAAFAGFTGVTVGLVNTHFALLPIPAIIQAPRRVDPHGQSWNRLKTAIDLPELI